MFVQSRTMVTKAHTTLRFFPFFKQRRGRVLSRTTPAPSTLIAPDENGSLAALLADTCNKRGV